MICADSVWLTKVRLCHVPCVSFRFARRWNTRGGKSNLSNLQICKFNIYIKYVVEIFLCSVFSFSLHSFFFLSFIFFSISEDCNYFSSWRDFRRKTPLNGENENDSRPKNSRWKETTRNCGLKSAISKRG